MPVPDAASAQEPGCQLDGRFALRVVFDVAWVGTLFASIVPIIDNGEGELSFAVLMELTSTRDGLQAKVRTCTSEVPDFVATLSRESYRARFAESVWDATSGTLLRACDHGQQRKRSCACAHWQVSKVRWTGLILARSRSAAPHVACWHS